MLAVFKLILYSKEASAAAEEACGNWIGGY